MPDIDTAAIREQWHRDAEQMRDWHETAWDLMAALDATRAERETSHRLSLQAVRETRLRAEAAEERAERLTEWWRQERDERMAAEARIAATLDRLDADDCTCPCECEGNGLDVDLRRALTRDTI